MSKRRLEIFDTLRVDSYLLHQSVFLSVRKLEQKSIHKTSNHFQKKSHTSQREQWSIPIDYWSHISYGSLCVSEPDIQLTKFFTYMWKETPNMEKKNPAVRKKIWMNLNCYRMKWICVTAERKTKQEEMAISNKLCGMWEVNFKWDIYKVIYIIILYRVMVMKSEKGA